MVDGINFKQLLAQFDTNKDGKISKQEAEKIGFLPFKVEGDLTEEVFNMKIKGLSLEKAGTNETAQPDNSVKATLRPVADYSDWRKVTKVNSFDELKSGSHSAIRDARYKDISGLTLSKEQLLDLCIDDTTVLSDEQKEMLKEPFENMKNPGLGVRDLHEQGITGKGVKIAIVDQALSSHKEYADRIIHYEEIGYDDNPEYFAQGSLHGAAVTSIASGETVGVAPDAEVVYFAASNIKFDDQDNSHSYNRDYAEAINKIVEMNNDLPEDKKIPVISISWGFASEAEDYQLVQDAVKKASENGIYVVNTGTFVLGANRDPQSDPDNPESYDLGAYLEPMLLEQYEEIKQQHPDVKLEDMLRDAKIPLVPMDHRTVADMQSETGYRYEGNDGGMSWAVPWYAGMYALAKQVRPDITPEEFEKAALDTATECRVKDGVFKGKLAGMLINPKALIENITSEKQDSN